MKPFFLPIAALLLFGCADDAQPAVAPVEDAPASIVRQPIAAAISTPTDTSLVAKIGLEATEHTFGTVREGTVISHDFNFNNTGRVPLLITDVRSTCGCTVSEWPRQPIAPGRGGTIRVTFDTSGKQGRQRKPISLTANTYPPATTLYVSGEVLK